MAKLRGQHPDAQRGRPKKTQSCTPAGFINGYEHEDRPPMSREEEVVAFVALRAGDESQRETIFRANVRFALQIAGLPIYRGRGLDPDDLAQEAVCGLLEAIDRFDETRGFKFISYAVWWIRQAILKAIADVGSTIRTPLNVLAHQHRVRTHQREIEAQRGGPVSYTEAAEDLGVADLPLVRVVSLDSPKPGYDPDNDRAANYNASPEHLDTLAVHPDDTLAVEQLREHIRALVGIEQGAWCYRLTQREGDILRAYYGLGDAPAITLEAIGVEMGLTRERVRQIKEMALAKLKLRINGHREELMQLVV